ncbi:pilus assembly protein [Herminiimonas sp.]|uniref:pilus assembly protein n=1 Tax=Herminiimonas sp. TaxID=1926289 RepID=UPI002716646E|nr:PilC/PilY family type IV pilus protein [Herminiimonas sp.]MDO8305048.1 PilC/PilY family type IV pilus protein [Herminiimonas sp.]
MKHPFHSLRFPLMLLALMLGGHAAHAAETDIANAPLASSSVDVVKPNVMFILDDSGSMDNEYAPDVANFSNTKFGAKSSHCNGMYFNPAIVYSPPVNADGTSFSDASFTAAWNNGYKTTDGTTNLENSVYYTYTGTTTNLGFEYLANGSVDTSKLFYTECNSTAVSGSALFPKVTITSASDATLKTNFANWYSYYRTRMLTMKTSAGRAFKNVGSAYRVGYSTIGYTGTSATSDDFLKIADFDATHKASFYAKLYKANPTHWTPLRAALSKAGQLYAGKLLTGSDDPVQYSCQQNFTILSTDGYWNTNEETTTYGPKGLDGNNVGNQDATELRPMYDGTTVTNVAYTTATITFSGSSNTLVSGITVNGKQIMSGPINDNEDSNKVASRTAALITKNGYTATVSGSVVTIKAPTALGAITYTPVVTKTGGMTATVTAFSTATTPVTSGGVSNSLADVAAYYYNTDLRTTALGNCTGALGGSADVCDNNVLGSGLDNKGSQHMTTFTLGLGVNGQLGYTENYLSGGSADFNAITNGTKNWPDPIANDGPERIDDLWHAAVNGRGSYFSAQTPDTLIKGITKALTSAKVRDGSGVAAATSNLEPVAGDNFLFLAMYRTSFWDGDLKAKTIDPSTGAVAATESWSAQAKLDTKVTATSETRTIYTSSGSASDKLKTFTWANLTADEKAYFNSMCAPTVRLSQCSDSVGGPNLTTVQRDLIPGENLLKFIRGQNGYEDQAGNTNPIYRDREHVLGDMIGSQPVYVKSPPFVYVDENYEAYKTREKDRLGMVYVAANDGMLHAFDATIGEANSGAEKWAYIPPMVLPNLYKLADKNYPANHQYYVDGAPTVGDICSKAPGAACAANEWKTILVGGLNSGGKGYYALDITDPANPKALWNFTDANDVDLGYSYGNPVITKRLDGTWVVVFTSGYNNHTGSGDGKGHLYVLNANTGVLLSKLDTTAGDTTTPSGLAKINAWVDSLSDNKAKRFYGGDLLGNVWRFDPDDRIAPTGNKVTLLAELGNVSPIGTQPITIKPELTEVTSAGVSYPVVNVASGRYLGISDLTNTSIQSIYALKDNLTETGLGKVRTAGVLVQQTLTTSADGTTRTTSSNAVDWASKSGWYMDLNPGNKSPGERVNVDMQQQLGLLTVAGNVPKDDACTPGGYAWIYSLDFKTGQFVEGATGNIAGRRQAGLVAGLKTLKLNTGKTVTLITDTGGTITVMDDPSSNPGSGNGARRVSWRELIAD